MSIPSPRDLLDFTDRVAVVTGAGSGLGSGIAVRFAEAGAAVAVHYNSSAEGAQEIVSQIEALGASATAIQADVTKRADVERLFGQAVESFGQIHVLVNNAGVYPISTLVDMSVEDWDLVIDSNLRSVFLCTQAAARQMIAQGGGGAVVNIASIEAENPAPMHSHYDAAKAGVVMHTRATALELGPHGIRVNAVSPGLIWREGIEEGWPEGVQGWLSRAPINRLGQPDDVADACLILASPAARWITGANLRVDGGMLTNRMY